MTNFKAIFWALYILGNLWLVFLIGYRMGHINAALDCISQSIDRIGKAGAQ